MDMIIHTTNFNGHATIFFKFIAHNSIQIVCPFWVNQT